MVTSYTYTKELDCCDGMTVTVRRTILRELDDSVPSGFIRHSRASDNFIGEYKALSHRNGNTRQYGINVTTKVGLIGSSSRSGQAVQAIGSILTPGNVSRVRSPVRSAAWRAITPGLPGGGRGIRKRNRAHRCPEGYQYGGRFTDNRLSTCGQQLFDIPSALGMAIGEIRRLARGEVGPGGRIIKPGPKGDDIIQRRRPMIPKVTDENRALKIKNTEKVITAMARPDVDGVRMIRRDGFQLEPVVGPAVLRTIPDNRDMEGATYVTSLHKVGDLGKDELGLLSNTGVTNVTYTMQDGSSVSIEKVRSLSVGERRKLGRTVNAAIKTDNSKDPAARLKFLSEETGDGIEYKENLKSASIAAALKAKPGKGGAKAPDVPESAELPGKKIGTVEDAISHINGGGPLSEIKPSILQEALRQANAFKKRPGGILEAQDGTKLALRSSSKDFEHLHTSVASEVQRHLGLGSSRVAFVGKGGKRRQYAVDAPTFDRSKSFDDAAPETVARMMLADLISGVDDRKASGVAFVGQEAVPTTVPSSLTELAKLKITDRAKESISTMRPVSGEGMYNTYYRDLRDAQKRSFQEEIQRLMTRAQDFNFTSYRDTLYRDGELSSAEKTHLNIIQKIVESRITALTRSRDALIERLEG
jgi:hypothetical protein